MHDDIIAMCVNAHCPGALKSPVKQQLRIPLARRSNRNAVDYMIWILVELLPAFDI